MNFGQHCLKKHTQSKNFYLNFVLSHLKIKQIFFRFYGSYKNIEGGRINEALEDLCGGLSEVYKVNCPKLAEIMEMSFKKSAFMGCSIPVSQISISMYYFLTIKFLVCK